SLLGARRLPRPRRRRWREPVPSRGGRRGGAARRAAGRAAGARRGRPPSAPRGARAHRRRADRLLPEVPMPGLMMDQQLTIADLLRRAATLFPEKTIATRTADGTRRTTYGALARRAARLANALRGLGVRPGDRVGSFAWNTQRHLELYLGAPSA